MNILVVNFNRFKFKFVGKFKLINAASVKLKASFYGTPPLFSSISSVRMNLEHFKSLQSKEGSIVNILVVNFNRFKFKFVGKFKLINAASDQVESLISRTFRADEFGTFLDRCNRKRNKLQIIPQPNSSIFS